VGRGGGISGRSTLAADINHLIKKQKSEEVVMRVRILPVPIFCGVLPMKRFTKEELAAAKSRLDASPDQGTDEEYFAAFLNLFGATAAWRETHAVLCLDRPAPFRFDSGCCRHWLEND